MQGKKTYQEKLFTNFRLSDRVPKDNFYRPLKEVLDFSFLYSATAGFYGIEGQKSIDPVVFFKLLLFGYLENQPSDRRIVHAASMRLDVLYFIGYDIDEELPWHSTLSRTRKLYNEEVFLELFKKVLKQCIDKGLLNGARQAVDSFLVKANAAMSSLIDKEVMKDAEYYNQQLKDNEERESKVSSPRSKTKSSNKTRVSTSDPDSRMAVKPEK
jgi:transposase